MLDDDVLHRLENNFTYHSPNDDQIDKYGEIGDEAKTFAKLLMHLCPQSRELSLALTNLEQAVIWANASIARMNRSLK